jgi:hypothetical protein
MSNSLPVFSPPHNYVLHMPMSSSEKFSIYTYMARYLLRVYLTVSMEKMIPFCEVHGNIGK